MKDHEAPTKDGRALEREVSRIYSLLGATVETRVLIKTYEIDIVASFRMGPLSIQVIAECKDYSPPSKVSDVDMRSFAVKLLAARELGQADKGVFVTTSNYSKNALFTAAAHGIQCLTLAELRNQLVDFSPYVDAAITATDSSRLGRYYVEQRGSELEEYTTVLAKDEAQQYIHSPLTSYVENLFLSGERQIALLGNFGTGKSSFCEMYCYRGLLQYKQNKSNRLPIYIPLRDFRSGFDIHQLIARSLRTGYGVAIDERLCHELQRMGRFIFVLDGLDEMAPKVDRTVLNENLREISRLATEGDNLYILTCRTHFFQERVVEDFLEDYRVVYLLDWSREDLRSYLAKRFPKRWEGIYRRLSGSRRLEELSRTPQFVDMLLTGLPETEPLNPHDLTSLAIYEQYVQKWVQLESKRRGAVMNPSTRRTFVEHLARKIFETGSSGVHFSELYELAREFSGYGDPTRLDYFDTDVRNCTFITRDSHGVYSFRHGSFMEYGCARAVRREIKEQAPDLCSRRELTEELLQFLGEMEFDESETALLHEWSQVPSMSESSRMLGKNAARILLALGRKLTGVAAERFRTVDDPWARIGEAIAAKDLSLFEEAVERYYPWLREYVVRMLRAYGSSIEVSAEDILQEVLIRLWSTLVDRGHLSRPYPDSLLYTRAFISHMVRSLAVSRSRHRRMLEEVPLNLNEVSLVEETWVRPVQEEEVQVAEGLRAARRVLTREEWEVFRDLLEGKSLRELAQELGVKPKVASGMISKVRRKVRAGIGA